MQPSPASPRLDALLKRLRSTLVGQVWLYGIGTTLAVAALWLAFAFLADWLLHVPVPVRLAHGLVLVVLPAVFLARSLFRWLRRVPDRAGLAQLVDRSHPELNDVLVSAVQLTDGSRPADELARPLVARVVEEAEARCSEVDLARVVAPREPRRRFALGLALSLATGFALGIRPELAGIFFQRLTGADVPWPQETHLALEVPVLGDRIRVEPGPDGLRVFAARGSDVPLLVRAEGRVPSEVTLHFSDGQTSVLTSGGAPLFRTVLRSVQGDLSFDVTGGDDNDHEPKVHLVVLQPPDVTSLAVHVRPPAYSGLPARTVTSGDVEVLAGSELRVHLEVDPPGTRGVARLLPGGSTVDLIEAPFPSRDAGAAPDSATTFDALAFDFTADASMRYRFELKDGTGLPNPDPGLYSVRVVEDRRPEVQLVSPSRAEVDVVLGGALPLRVRIEDDFGVKSARWQTSTSATTDAPLHAVELPLEPLDPSRGGGGTPTSFGRVRLFVDELGGVTTPDGNGPLSEGTQLTLQVRTEDNREPVPNVSLSAPVRLRVVTPDEFQRRLQDALARAGAQANRLSRLQVEKQQRTAEVLAALSSDALDSEAPDSDERAQITSLATGQKRVHGDARALTRDLTEIAESLLYSGIDEHAGLLLQAIDESLAEYTDRSFHPEPWRDLAERYEAGSLGKADLAGQLIRIVGISLTVSEDHALAAQRSMEQALASAGPAAMRDALDLAYQQQTLSVEAIERLLEQLAEWDNYQSILTLTRDLLNRQKNLTERTRTFARDH